MAITIAKQVLSGSTDGLPIVVSATVAKAIHTGSSLSTVLEELYVFAANSSTNVVTVNLEWGASGSHVTSHELQPKGAGLQLLVAGNLIRGRSSNTVLSIQASTSNVVNVLGYVHRITES